MAAAASGVRTASETARSATLQRQVPLAPIKFRHPFRLPRRRRSVIAARAPIPIQPGLAPLRPVRLDCLQRRDPLAGGRFELLLQRRHVVGDELGPVARAADLDVEALLRGEVGIGLFLIVFWWRGVQLGRQERIRGAEMVTARELRRRVRPAHLRALARLPGAARFRPYAIAGIPYPERTETQHTIVSGTTGSGTTVLITDLVSQIRSRGERCVLYDKMGSYTRSFFDPGRDVLMNPLDARAPRWSPFLEARNPRDFDMMAAALIPQQKDTVDPFWVTAARQLFSNGAGVLRQKGVKDNKVLVDHLLKTDLTELAEAMEGTVAQSIVDPENPKTALSVRAMLTANLSGLEFLPDEGKPFSIREWISDEERGGFLFLTSRGDQHASLRGLISTWLEIAVNAMLSLAQDDGRRIWVILDEFPTLHQVPSLQPGLAESRQRASLRWRVASAAQGRRQDDMNQALQPRMFVDGNNVMGSRPDGWWRDRAGAARRIVAGVPYRDSRRAWRPR